MRARARRQVTNGTQFRWLPSFYRSPPCPLLSSELSARYSRSFALACYTEPVSVIKIGVFHLQVTAEKLHISPCWSDQANVLMGGIDHMVRWDTYTGVIDRTGCGKWREINLQLCCWLQLALLGKMSALLTETFNDTVNITPFSYSKLDKSRASWLKIVKKQEWVSMEQEMSKRTL